jgi:hypothetical protein
VPDFSPLCRRQKTLDVSLSHCGSKGPLNILIDSTGIKAESEGRPKRRPPLSLGPGSGAIHMV